MAWDKNRPVPYARLVKEWAIYAGVMIVIFAVFLRNSTSVAGMILGLVVSFPLWIGLSWVLAKFGYSRKTYSQLRSERAARTATGSTSGSSGAAPTERAKPAPTKRTSTGYSNRPQRNKRK